MYLPQILTLGQALYIKTLFLKYNLYIKLGYTAVSVFFSVRKGPRTDIPINQGGFLLVAIFLIDFKKQGWEKTLPTKKS